MSVLMGVYNDVRYLPASVESILAQTYTEFEFVIVDDASTDGSHDLLATYAGQDTRIRLVRNSENVGLTKSLNRALTLARGEYLARLDADDISLPDRFERQVRILDEHPEIVICGSSCFVVDEQGKAIRIDTYPVSDTAIRWQMLFHNAFAHSSVMARHGILARHSLKYNDESRFSQDYELWSELLQFGRGFNVEEPLIKYRVHGNQLGNVAADRQQEIADRIAQRNQQRLGVHSPVDVVRKVRRWFVDWPARVESSDYDAFTCVADLLRRFSTQSTLDYQSVQRIRQAWVDRMLWSLPVRDVLSVAGFEAFWSVVRLRPGRALRHMVERVQAGLRHRTVRRRVRE